jgi:phosphoribosyl-ATP pyrophosphohydrolase
MNSPSKQVILLPKGAVTEGKDSRNPLLDLLVRAGYDKVRSGFDPKSRNRTDQVQQGDFVFRAVKGAPALAAQFELFRNDNVGVIAGSEVVAEAQQRALQYGVAADIRTLLSLNIGPCSMQFLVPNQQRVFGPTDIDERLLFTKYPYLLRSVLRASGRSAAVRTTDGADTRVVEYQAQYPQRSTGAFEVVGTGETARANNLQIVGADLFPYPSGKEMAMPYLDLLNIRTDLFVTNAGRITSRARQMLRELGMALESAKESNMRVPVTFNVLQEKASNFDQFGMKGPSEMGVRSRDKSTYVALQIYVEPDKVNSMRPIFFDLGAEDMAVGEPQRMEIGPKESEVMRVLSSSSDAAETADVPDRNAELAEWILALRATIDDREKNPPAAGSSTVTALEKGLEFCVARYANEVAELGRALRRGDRKEAVTEAGQAVFWLLVSLQARRLPIERVIDALYRPEKEEVDDGPRDEEPQPIDWAAELEGNIRRMRTAVRTGDLLELNGLGYLLNEGVTNASVAVGDKALELTTAFRKRGDSASEVAAADGLGSLICLCELAGIPFDEVMDAERGKK